nr:MAG TPA: hypothetical protein [Microviridae sp.]
MFPLSLQQVCREGARAAHFNGGTAEEVPPTKKAALRLFLPLIQPLRVVRATVWRRYPHGQTMNEVHC